MLFGDPGLGLGHFFFYIPIARGARDRPRVGAAAGLTAALYAVATVNPNLPTVEVLTVVTPIRLVTFVASGALIGWFARSNRELIERLEVLAKRDRLTGLPNMREFESVDQRLESAKFVLLLGDGRPARDQRRAGLGAGDVVLAARGHARQADAPRRDARTRRRRRVQDPRELPEQGRGGTANASSGSSPSRASTSRSAGRVPPTRGPAASASSASPTSVSTRKLVRGRRTGEPQATRLGLGA